MTAVLARPEQPDRWAQMPGWNVVADLTPPELINSRWIAVLRRRIIAVLIAVVLLCVAAYALAAHRYSAASESNDAASTGTIGLQQQAAKYSPVTSIETAVDGIRGQVATLLTDDVDVARLVAEIRAALPTSMTIGALALNVAPGAGTGAGATGLDASGQTTIGSLTISGGGRTLDDLPVFVDHLAALKGLVNVLPSSNQLGAKSTQFAVTADLTNMLYTHRYDLSKTGGK